jgi:alpha-glucosidase
MADSPADQVTDQWWRRAVIYEIYPRSFADGNGDGEGDLTGILEHLPYLVELGVDGIWIAPWYPSPLADGGYDITDFCDIHPMFGSLQQAEHLIAEAHRLGLRVILDVVPNHTSDQHPWFRAARAAPAGSPERARYLFRDGKGPTGELPPNNWISAFGGSAWTRLLAADGTPEQWYLHLFAPEQPDLNWRDPAVLDEFDHVLRFWLERGVDGIRVDAAPAIVKVESLPDADYRGDLRFATLLWDDNPHWDVDDVHSVLRRWRRIGDSFPGERAFVVEAIVGSPERLGRYLRPDEMHTAFNFHFMKSPWQAQALRDVIDATLDQLAPLHAPATWVTSSHDEARLVTRYGRRTTAAAHISDGQDETPDLALGTRRARAAALLTLALPGGAYLYQGEELGLPHVDDLPDEVLQDPLFLRTDGRVRGRDGSRVPMPWRGDRPPYGFSPDHAAAPPWLPPPAGWAPLTVQAQSADPGSTLNLHRQALRLRRSLAGLRSDRFCWRPGPAGVLDFDRGPGFRCLVNLSGREVALDPEWTPLIVSTPGRAGTVPNDAAAWLTPVGPEGGTSC